MSWLMICVDLDGLAIKVPSLYDLREWTTTAYMTYLFITSIMTTTIRTTSTIAAIAITIAIAAIAITIAIASSIMTTVASTIG